MTPDLDISRSALLTDIAMCLNNYRLASPGLYCCILVPVQLDEATRLSPGVMLMAQVAGWNPSNNEKSAIKELAALRQQVLVEAANKAAADLVTQHPDSPDNPLSLMRELKDLPDQYAKAQKDKLGTLIQHFPFSARVLDLPQEVDTSRRRKLDSKELKAIKDAIELAKERIKRESMGISKEQYDAFKAAAESKFGRNKFEIEKVEKTSLKKSKFLNGDAVDISDPENEKMVLFSVKNSSGKVEKKNGKAVLTVLTHTHLKSFIANVQKGKSYKIHLSGLDEARSTGQKR